MTYDGHDGFPGSIDGGSGENPTLNTYYLVPCIGISVCGPIHDGL